MLRIWSLVIIATLIGFVLWSMLLIGVIRGWWLPTLGAQQGQIIREPSARYGSARPFRTYGGGTGVGK